jgi:hypothetical protein
MVLFRSFICISALCVLSACSIYDFQSRKTESPETLLESDGRWEMVEVEEASDPLKQHMQARRQVDPTKTSNSHDYTLKANAQTMRARPHSRILHMERRPETLGDIQAASGETGAGVLSVRIGEHPGKTRIVLDLDGVSPFRHDLDRNENVLIITLPEAVWKTSSQKDFSAHPLLGSYRTQPGKNGGTVLVLRFKKPVRLAAATALGPGGAAAYRILFDIAPAK